MQNCLVSTRQGIDSPKGSAINDKLPFQRVECLHIRLIKVVENNNLRDWYVYLFATTRVQQQLSRSFMLIIAADSGVLVSVVNLIQAAFCWASILGVRVCVCVFISICIELRQPYVHKNCTAKNVNIAKSLLRHQHKTSDEQTTNF